MKVKAKRRFTEHKKVGKPLTLRADHPAVTEHRTLFPTRVGNADPDLPVFKSGVNSRKIGSHVTKGAWKGMPIYTLTLEERATCPTYCEHWQDCFGNKMQWPIRWVVDADFGKILYRHAGLLQAKYPEGFVIRLHVLGDFPNVEYVQWWEAIMFAYPGCNVFGYTRWAKDCPIGRALRQIGVMYSDRWKVRWSERGGEMGTVTRKEAYLRGNTPDGIVCPAQTEQSECCGTCALCWSTTKPIVFLNH